jgi:uncharacterized protein YdiU (UPF0061 family)
MNEMGWNFDNSYVALPEMFYAKVKPAPVAMARMALFNHALAHTMGLDAGRLASDDGAAIFVGNRLPEGTALIAQAYAGHQFGHFTMLGDGRAIMLGEHITPTGTRLDIQLKGSGQTPFSRRGDGKAALGPMLREYIMSEAMHALRVPTTRSLAVVTTGEPVFREAVLPGAVLTRVAASHIRVGTFEYVAARNDVVALRALADYAVHRHYPEWDGAENRHRTLLNIVIDRQAELVSKWMHVGFIHGVMNTDNMAVSGETIDYGPCAFMDAYDPETVFSSIDHQGRYAYGAQPRIANWNLARFAETLLPLLHPEPEKAINAAREAVEAFPDRYQHYWLSGMRKKLGLFTEEADDGPLAERLLAWMHRHRADYTNTFRALASESLPAGELFQDAMFRDWHASWQTRLSRNPEPKKSAFCLMQANNPNIIPRNHRVEEALESAVERADYSGVHKLLEMLANPYDDSSVHADYRMPPPPSTSRYRTFCGT